MNSCSKLSNLPLESRNNNIRDIESNYRLNTLANALGIEINVNELKISPIGEKILNAALFDDRHFEILDSKTDGLDPQLVVLLFFNAFKHIDSDHAHKLLRKVKSYYPSLVNNESLKNSLNSLLLKMSENKEIASELFILLIHKLVNVTDTNTFFKIIIQCFKTDKRSLDYIYDFARDIKMPLDEQLEFYAHLYRAFTPDSPESLSYYVPSINILGKLYLEYFESLKGTRLGDLLQLANFPFEKFSLYLINKIKAMDLHNVLVDWVNSIDQFAPKEYANEKQISTGAPLLEKSQMEKIENARRKSEKLSLYINAQENKKALYERKIIQCYSSAFLPSNLPILLMSAVLPDGNGDYGNHCQVAKHLIEDPANFDVHSKLFFTPGKEKIISYMPPLDHPRYHVQFSTEGKDLSNNNPLYFSHNYELEGEPFNPINYVRKAVKNFMQAIDSTSLISKSGYQFIRSFNQNSAFSHRKIEPYNEQISSLSNIIPKVVLEVSFRSFQNAIYKSTCQLFPESPYGFIKEYSWNKKENQNEFRTGPFIGGALFFDEKLLEDRNNISKARLEAWTSISPDIKKLVFGDQTFEKFFGSHFLHVAYFRHQLTAQVFLYTLAALYSHQNKSPVFVLKCDLNPDIFNFEFIQSLGYSSILYVSGNETKTINLGGKDGKVLKILNILPIQQTDLFHLMNLSNAIVGCTGDCSFTEVLSLGLVPFYEVTDYKWQNYVPQAFADLIKNQFPDSSKLLEYYKTMFKLTRRANKASLYGAIKPGVLERRALELSNLLVDFPYQEQMALRDYLLQECSPKDYISGIVRKVLFNKMDPETEKLEKQILDTVEHEKDPDLLFDQLKGKIQMISEGL